MQALFFVNPLENRITASLRSDDWLEHPCSSNDLNTFACWDGEQPR